MSKWDGNGGDEGERHTQNPDHAFCARASHGWKTWPQQPFEPGQHSRNPRNHGLEGRRRNRTIGDDGRKDKPVEAASEVNGKNEGENTEGNVPKWHHGRQDV